MKQQMTDNQDRTRGDIDALRAEIGRLYTTVQWALGLIITVILALAGFLIRKPGDKPQKEGNEKSAPPPEPAASI